ncbi:hypothetical protein K523DRAFT_404179 [Schizophyllum commune Tattone D]|nr:hypothetical protein K523DRAFT_404179 [Schizophyllum commune Tattone D]
MDDSATRMFAAGERVTLATDNGQRLVFTIERPFTPFTKSVAVLARCAELSSTPVVVKIFDPRFLDERLPMRYRLARPWSLKAEPEDDVEGQAARAALFEAHFRRLSTECFTSERDAYARLQGLQGDTLPRLLAIGQVVPPDERAFRPPALVLEYVEGTAFDDTPLEAFTPDVCTKLVHTADSFATLGVSHNDVNVNNVIIGPGRVVFIDFGCAALRRPDQDDESWSHNVRYGSDGRRMRIFLREKGVTGMDELLQISGSYTMSIVLPEQSLQRK